MVLSVMVMRFNEGARFARLMAAYIIENERKASKAIYADHEGSSQLQTTSSECMFILTIQLSLSKEKKLWMIIFGSIAWNPWAYDLRDI